MYPKKIIISKKNYHVLVSPFIEGPQYFVAYITFCVYFIMFSLAYYKKIQNELQRIFFSFLTTNI